MKLDAIIISDSGEDSLSDTNPLKFKIEDQTASIQLIKDYLENDGEIVKPIHGDGVLSWASAPKLNGIHLLNYLAQHKFHVEIVDRFYEEEDRFRDLLIRKPKAIIISTTFIYSKPSFFRFVEDIRSIAPDSFIIAGGHFVYFSYLMVQRSHEPDFETELCKDDLLFLNIKNEPPVDLYIISLRGEPILIEALKILKEGRFPKGLPNTTYLHEKRYNLSDQIDDISVSKNDLIDWSSLPDYVFKSGVVPMQASNGCPYHCAFCNFVKDRRMMYVKPIDQLISELKAVSRRGIRYVWFVDDNFRLGRGNINSVCQRLIKENLEIGWMSFIRASTLKNADFKLLKQSGCVEVQLGLESADSQILKNMNKQSDPELYAEVIQKLFKVGISCSCYFIFGFPGETDRSADRTRKFLKKIEHPELEGLLSWSLFPFLLSPMSPIYESEMRKKYRLSGYMSRWKHNTMDTDKAKAQVLKTFQSLEHSGPIYRNDNLKLLRNLTPLKRKQFIGIRQRLSKKALYSNVEKKDIIEGFADLFQI